MKTLQCQKRRRVVIRKKDGSKDEVYRCAHGATKNYRDNVDESACNNCALRQPLISIAGTCKEHPPNNPIWPEPRYKDGDIIYPYEEGVPKPPVPEGYTRKAEEGPESWQFESQWGKCPYRQYMNRRTPKGDVQVHAYCTVRTNYRVENEECKQCLAALADMEGVIDVEEAGDNSALPESIENRLDKHGVPKYPGATELLDNYWKAVKRWIAAGRPARDNAEVARIHEEFCSSCDWYDPELKRCKGCGCSVRPKGITLLNKIKMKTEHCPRHFW